MKKIRLVGKKLYRIGPLKCFKQHHYGHGTGGAGTTITRSKISYAGGPTLTEKGPTYYEAQRRYDRDQELKKQKEIEKKKEEERIKKKKADLKKLMEENPDAFRNQRELGDPETVKMANELTQAEETKKENAAAEKVKADKKVKNALKKGVAQLLKGAVVNVVGLGTVTAAEAIASELVSPEKKAAILNKLTPQFMKGEPVTASPEEIQAELDSGNYDNPGNPNIFSGSASTQKRKQESKGDDFELPEIPGQVVAKTVVEEKAEEEGPKGPGKMTEEQLTEMLEKRARGEDSIVDREAKIARERGLAQQLASVRGARGVTAGQRLRALQRGSETTEREIQPQIAVAKAQEQKAAQDALLGLKRGDRLQAEKFAEAEKDRKAALERQKIASGKGGGGGGGGGGGKMGGASSFLNKLSSGVKFFKGAKKFLGFEEGGFVSGKGTETSDSIPARLSDGEFVIKASAVRGLGKAMGAKDKKEERKKGVDFLYKLQDKMDKVEKFQKGGEAINSLRELEELEVDDIRQPMPEMPFVREEPKMRDKLVGPLRVDMMGPSVMSDRERSQATDLKEDPRVFKEKRRPKMRGLMEQMNKRVRKKIGGRKSSNEEKLKKLLEKKKTETKEKDKIIDKLMKDRVKPLMQGSAKPGKFFQEEEELPMAKGGEAYSRPKKAFREAIGHEAESRFHDKAFKDTKHGGARRKFRHFQDGGPVDMKGPGMVKEQFKMPSAGGFGSVVAAQGDLQRRIEELERKVGK